MLEDAAAIDAKAASGQSILPLCGLPVAVKDSIDVIGYPTTGATPGLAGKYVSEALDNLHTSNYPLYGLPMALKALSM